MHITYEANVQFEEHQNTGNRHQDKRAYSQWCRPGAQRNSFRHRHAPLCLVSSCPAHVSYWRSKWITSGGAHSHRRPYRLDRERDITLAPQTHAPQTLAPARANPGPYYVSRVGCPSSRSGGWRALSPKVFVRVRGFAASQISATVAKPLVTVSPVRVICT